MAAVRVNDTNLFAYCGNNPIIRRDASGTVWDTVLDVVSIVGDVASIIANPSDVLGYVELAADVVGLVLPGVTGGGTIVRIVANSDNVTDAIRTADNIIDTSRTYKSTSKLGTKLHNAYDPLQNVVNKSEKIRNKPISSIIKGSESKLRPDAVDAVNNIIYELKPYSKQNYKKALNQARRYATELGGKWTIVIDMYMPR